MANNHLIIGLGGTGGNVIREYRKLYVEKHKNLKGLDNVKFLWFDTSKSDMDKSVDWKVNGIPIGLEENVERYYMKPHDLNVLDILKNTSNYPTISSWIGTLNNEWHPSKINQTIIEGASGQIRRLGRLNFALYVDTFLKTVKSTVSALVTGKQNASVDIHIVAGLAGGTGSGGFIDAMAQILEDRNGINVDRVFAYVLTPSSNIKGESTGFVNKVSLYYGNGYAALKELNAYAIGSAIGEESILFNEIPDILGGLNVYDLSDASFGKKLYDKKRHQVAYIVTEEAISQSDFINMTEEQRWFRTANWLYIKTIFNNATFKEICERTDTAENKSVTPSALWGQASNNIGFGATRLMIPKQEMRDYFRNYFLVNALRKVKYNNFVEKQGFVDKPKDIDPDKEIETHKLLAREWSLTIAQLGHDIIDANLPRIHQNFVPKYSNIEEEITKNVKDILNHISNHGYKNNPIDERDLLSTLHTAGLEYISSDFRSVGARKYFKDWSKTDNVEKFADYIKVRILTHIFGYNNKGSNNWVPLSQVVNVVKYFRQDYFNKLKSDLLTAIDNCDKKADKLTSDFAVAQTNYKKEFGFLGNKAKKSDFKEKAQNILIEMYTSMVEGESYSLALEIIGELQKNTLVEVEKIVEEATKGVTNLIKDFYKKLEEQDPRKQNNKVNGIEAYSPDKIIGDMEDYLKKNESELNDYIRDIESQIYAQLNSFSNGTTDEKGMIGKLEVLGADEADKNLQKGIQRLNLGYNLYEDNLIKILYKDYGGDASNSKLKAIIDNLFKNAAPAIKIKQNPDVIVTESTIVILPINAGLDKEDDKLIAFKESIQKIIKERCGQDTKIINTTDEDKNNQYTINSPEYHEGYDEIIVVRLKSNFPLGDLDVIQSKLYKEYTSAIERLGTANGIDAKFLMHIQDVSHVPEIIPIDDRRRIELFIPLVILLQIMDSFQKDVDILQIEKRDKFETVIEEESFYFDKTIEETLKGEIFYKQERKFPGWKSNRWLNSVTYYGLKALVFNKVKRYNHKSDLMNNLIAFSKELSQSDPRLFKIVSHHFNEIESVVESIKSEN